MQLRCNFPSLVYLRRGLDTFSVRWVGGERKIKANLSQSWSWSWGWAWQHFLVYVDKCLPRQKSTRTIVHWQMLTEHVSGHRKMQRLWISWNAVFDTPCEQSFCAALIFVLDFCQAQPQLNSTQSQLKLRLRLALVPPDPTTHPATWDSSFLDSALDYFLTI